MFHDPTFWVFIAFLIVLVFFGKKISLFVLKFLDARISQVEKDLEEAHMLSEKAQDSSSYAAQKAREAEEEIQRIIEYTEEEITFLKEEQKKKIKALMERKENQFNKRIQNLQEQTLVELRNEMADLLYSVGEAFLKEQNKKEASKFVKESLLLFPKKLSRTL